MTKGVPAQDTGQEAHDWSIEEPYISFHKVWLRMDLAVFLWMGS